RALLAAIIARYPGNDLTHAAPRAERAASLNLQSLTVPTLIISGAHDLASRRLAARQLAARLSGAQLAVIARAGHLPHLGTPDAYNPLCRQFLTSHCTRATS